MHMRVCACACVLVRLCLHMYVCVSCVRHCCVRHCCVRHRACTCMCAPPTKLIFAKPQKPRSLWINTYFTITNITPEGKNRYLLGVSTAGYGTWNAYWYPLFCRLHTAGCKVCWEHSHVTTKWQLFNKLASLFKLETLHLSTCDSSTCTHP